MRHCIFVLKGDEEHRFGFVDPRAGQVRSAELLSLTAAP